MPDRGSTRASGARPALARPGRDIGPARPAVLRPDRPGRRAGRSARPTPRPRSSSPSASTATATTRARSRFPAGGRAGGRRRRRRPRSARRARRSASTPRPPASASSASSRRSGSRSATSGSRRSWRSPRAAPSSCAVAGRGRRILEAPLDAFLPDAPIEIVERDDPRLAAPLRRLPDRRASTSGARPPGSSASSARWRPSLGRRPGPTAGRARRGSTVRLAVGSPSRSSSADAVGSGGDRRAAPRPRATVPASPGPRRRARALEDRRAICESSAPANSTTIARISAVIGPRARASTPAGQRTASPAATRRCSSPTRTQPPPSITTNQVVFGLSWGSIAPPCGEGELGDRRRARRSG